VSAMHEISATTAASDPCAFSARRRGVVNDLLYFGSVSVHDADVFGRALVEAAGEDDAAAVR
jgi:hypothetical protein